MPADTPALEPADTLSTQTEGLEQIQPTNESVTELEQAPAQEEKELETPDDVESEETEGGEGEATQYLELDGEEHSLDDVRMWQKGHMMQSDYTKKTTALAEERTSFNAERETERENLLKEKAAITEMRDTLTVLVAEDESIDWAELKEDDPDRYIELKERADNRRAALEKVKAERETPVDDPALIQSETEKLFAAHPTWLDDKGKLTEEHTKDAALISEYAIRAGFSDTEFKGMTRAHYLTTMLKAAKYDAIQDKGRDIKSKREKVPIVTKPKAPVKAQSKTVEDAWFPNVKD